MEMTKPITDIKVSTGPEIPAGFLQIPVEVNFGFPSRIQVPIETIYINYHRRAKVKNQTLDPITDVTVLIGQHTPAPSPQWTKDPIDLNRGVGGNFLWLCSTRGGPEMPILDLIIRMTSAGHQEPPYIEDDEYTIIPVDLNRGAKGAFFFL